MFRNDSNVPFVACFLLEHSEPLVPRCSKMFQASEDLLVQAEEAKDLKEKTEERVWFPGFVIGCDAFELL